MNIKDVMLSLDKFPVIREFVILKEALEEMSNKKTPAGASIGTSIALVKNILNGRDGYFIKSVIDELVRLL